MPRMRTISSVPARMGGNEFVLVASGFSTGNSLDLFRQRLRARMEQPVLVNDRPMVLKTSIGVAVFPTDATSPRDLLHAADIAMYADKRARTETVPLIAALV